MAIKRSQYQKALRPKQVSNPVVAEARRRRVYKYFGITTLWLIATGLIAATLLSPWTLVTEVVLSGVNDTADRTTVRALQQSVRQSCIHTTCGRLWQVRYEPLAAILRTRYPWAEQILLTRKFPHTVELQVREDQSRLRVCLPSGQCYRTVAGTGELVPLAVVRDARTTVNVASGQDSPRLSASTATWLQTLGQTLPGLPMLESPVALSAHSLTDTEYTLNLTSGRKALLSTAVDPNTVRELLLALPQLGTDPVVYDLRFPERVYYKLPAPPEGATLPADTDTPASGTEANKDTKKPDAIDKKK